MNSNLLKEIPAFDPSKLLNTNIEILLTDFILNAPEESEKRITNLHPQSDSTTIQIQLIGLRIFAIAMVLSGKLKDNLEIKDKLIQSIIKKVYIFFEDRNGSEDATTIVQSLIKIATEYDEAMSGNLNQIGHVPALFAVKLGASDNVSLLHELLLIFKENLEEVANIINAAKEKSVPEISESENREMQNKIKKAKIISFFIGLLGLFISYKYFSNEYIFMGVISAIVTFRQITTINALGNFGMRQRTGSNITSSIAIIILALIYLLI